MLKYYLFIFMIAAGVSYLLTPLMRRLSIKMGWLDNPNWRKINNRPMPLLGGVAIYTGIVLSLLLFILTKKVDFQAQKILGLLGSSFVIFLVGIQDDTGFLSARRKFIYQIIAASIAYLFGYHIIEVSDIFGGSFQAPAIISMGLTIFWIVGFTNAINLMDGLDGLAAGVTAIISGSLFFSAVRNDHLIPAVLAVALAGGALGFLRHNFYPAKIFMGDCGSMTLGFMLALISIEGAYKGTTFVTLCIPAIAMALPAMDTLLSILRRLAKGRGIFKADKEHIHHKMLVYEGSQKEAVLKLYLLTGSFGLIATALSRMKGIWAFLAIALTAVLALRWIINSKFLDFMQVHADTRNNKRRAAGEQRQKV